MSRFKISRFAKYSMSNSVYVGWSEGDVLSVTFSSRETKDNQDRGVSQEIKGPPEEMCVVCNIIIYTHCWSLCFEWILNNIFV